MASLVIKITRPVISPYSTVAFQARCADLAAPRNSDGVDPGSSPARIHGVVTVPPG